MKRPQRQPNPYRIRISNDELMRELVGGKKNFPKYATQLLNQANQNSQGTRPKVVGQLSELIKQFPDKTYQEWEKWYLSKHPNSIGDAAEKVSKMMDNFRGVIKKIGKPMIRKWVKDLVLEKTFIGFRFQGVILKRIAAIKGVGFRSANPGQESRGIDGFIGKIPVSIKPETYKSKRGLPERIYTEMIYYRKDKSGLEIDASSVLKK